MRERERPGENHKNRSESKVLWECGISCHFLIKTKYVKVKMQNW